MLSVPEIFAYSSNIGSARMAVAAGAERQRAFLAKLGLLEPVPIEFDKVEVAKPHFPHPWREVNVMTIAFGHGIAVTPLHMITATAAMINGGILHPPTMLKVPPAPRCRGAGDLAEDLGPDAQAVPASSSNTAPPSRPRRPATSSAARPAPRRRTPGGHYEEKKLMSSFIGAFPMNDRKIRHTDPGRRAARQQGKPRLCNRRVDRRAGDRPHHLSASRRCLGVEPVDENSPELIKSLQIESLAGKNIEDY
jgi:cell division protein FtsI (penicillin-binding protein 3)